MCKHSLILALMQDCPLCHRPTGPTCIAIVIELCLETYCIEHACAYRPHTVANPHPPAATLQGMEQEVHDITIFANENGPILVPRLMQPQALVRLSRHGQHVWVTLFGKLVNCCFQNSPTGLATRHMLSSHWQEGQMTEPAQVWSSLTSLAHVPGWTKWQQQPLLKHLKASVVGNRASPCSAGYSCLHSCALPSCCSFLGYLGGRCPPGERSQPGWVRATMAADAPRRKFTAGMGEGYHGGRCYLEGGSSLEEGHSRDW